MPGPGTASEARLETIADFRLVRALDRLQTLTLRQRIMVRDRSNAAEDLRRRVKSGGPSCSGLVSVGEQRWASLTRTRLAMAECWRENNKPTVPFGIRLSSEEDQKLRQHQVVYPPTSRSGQIQK